MKKENDKDQKVSVQEIHEFLSTQAEEKYRIFTSRLLPDTDGILGVRLPVLRKYAREIGKRDWRDYLKHTDAESFEEILLYGMVIGYVKDISVEERLQYVKAYIPRISNWSVCDSFCSGLKFIKEEKEKIRLFLHPYFLSDKEFEVRFAVVVLLDYFIEDNYIEWVIGQLDQVANEAYYAKMAVAWAISICFAKYPERMLQYLTVSNLDVWTYQKALQKIVESLQVDKEYKELVKQMRKNL